MRIEGALIREPGEHPIPGGMRVAERGDRCRPRTRYRALVRTPHHVAWLRRHRVPVYLLTDGWVTRSRYPVRFRPWLVIAESIVDSVSTDYRVLPLRDADSLRRPGLEELVTWLLRFDPLAARAVALRNRGRLRRIELYRRIRNEGLEREATRVRLQQLVPLLPKVGEPLPASDLRWVDENNPDLGRPE